MQLYQDAILQHDEYPQRDLDKDCVTFGCDPCATCVVIDYYRNIG